MKRFSLIFLLFILTPPALGLGVAQDYLPDDTLKLDKGELRYFKLTLQNPDNFTLPVEVEVNSGIAELNGSKRYNLSPKSYNTEVFIKIMVPEEANPGDRHKVSYSVSPSKEGPRTPSIGMKIKITGSFDVLVGGDETEEKEPEKSSIFLKTGVVFGIILLLFLLWKISFFFSKKLLNK